MLTEIIAEEENHMIVIPKDLTSDDIQQKYMKQRFRQVLKPVFVNINELPSSLISQDVNISSEKASNDFQEKLLNFY
ncbi:hypothetical protein C1645_814794 [Glomus cerebriforme]|uniref:Uncharacterized protein n=1 Tax=Glomus cerebriforme TaxID=658196 RepID=A0A397TFB2_9GLOM|nr:hypothetical protein C1645_814794 [Glomus cerebriforme]